MLVCTHCRIALRDHETQCPRDGQPGEEIAFPEFPRALQERFEVVQPFAFGGTGALWLVDSRESGRRGVLKLLHKSGAHKPTDKQRIRREWTKQTTLSAPHLASVYESGEVDGRPWCLRAWAPGVSLDSQLRRGALEPEQALSIGAQLADALDALHRAGLLHRDLRPGHVVVEPEPENGSFKATVIDAGCPQPVKGPSGKRLWGTPAYLAPEQVEGKLVSFRSDLYALGCLLYATLAGHPPFEDDDPAKVMRMQREADVPERPAGLDPAMDKLLGSLLAKEAQRRPFSAQKVRKALMPFMPGKSPKVPTATFATGGPSATGAKVSVPPPIPPSVQRPVSTPPPPPPAAARPVSTPPPPPPAALRSSRPPAVPSKDEGTQPVDLNQVVEINESLAQDPLPGEGTQPIDLNQIMEVNERLADARSTNADDVPDPDEAVAEDHDSDPPVVAPEMTVPAAQVRVTAPTEDPAPRAAEGSQVVGPDSDEDEEEDEGPTAVIDRDHIAGVVDAARKQTLLGMPSPAQVPAAPQSALPPPSTEASNVEAPAPVPAGDVAASVGVAGTLPDERTAPAPLGAQDEATQVTRNPLLKQLQPILKQLQPMLKQLQPMLKRLQPMLKQPLKRENQRLAGGAAAAVLLLLLLVWAFSGDDAPAQEQSVAAAASEQPSTTAGAAPAEVTAAQAAAPQGNKETPTPKVEPLPETTTAAKPTVEPLDTAEKADDSEDEADDSEDEAPQPTATASADDSTDETDNEAQAQADEKAAAAKSAEPRERRAKRSDGRSKDGVDEATWKRARDAARRHYRARRYRKAEAAYERAAKANPRDAGTFAGLGGSRLAQGHARTAVRAYRQAVRLSPRTSGFHAALGRAYEEAGNRRRARASYKKALRLDRRNRAAKTGLARL